MLPENTILGTLGYIEVYDFYDTPQFFSCKNEKGEIYLGLVVEDDDDYLTYLFVLIEDLDILLTAKYEIVNIPDFYLDLNYRVFKGTISEDGDNAIEIPQIEVESYFSEYIKRRKESQEEFSALLQELHRDEHND